MQEQRALTAGEVRHADGLDDDGDDADWADGADIVAEQDGTF